MSREEIGKRPDVVFMAVGEDDCDHVGCRSTSQLQSGKTRSTPSISSSGNMSPQSISRSFPSISMRCRIAPDFAEATKERDRDCHKCAEGFLDCRNRRLCGRDQRQPRGSYRLPK